jgi:hypothetical protein
MGRDTRRERVKSRLPLMRWGMTWPTLAPALTSRGQGGSAWFFRYSAADEARARGIPCAAGKCVLGGNARTLIEGGKRGFVKLVFHRESRALLGAQLCCYRATDLISELALAVTLELTAAHRAEQLLRPVRPHPTFAEAISEAVEAAFPLS